MVVTIVLILILVAFGISFYAASISERNELYKKVAENYGLALEKKGLFSTATITGNYKDYYINVYRVLEGDQNDNSIYLQVYLSYSEKSHQNDIKHEDVFSFSNSGNEINIDFTKPGKKDFVTSPYDVSLISVLNLNLRSRVRYLNSTTANCRISDDGITGDFYMRDVKSVEGIINCIDGIVHIADGLTRPGDDRQRLLENMKTERDEAVKYLNFHTLMTNYGDDKDVKKLFNEMKKSSDIDEQILAAMYLGEKGMSVLLKILRKNKDLSKNTLFKIIGILAKNKIDDDYSILLDLAEKYPDEETLGKIIYAIGALGLSQYENFILENIENESKNIRQECIESIASCGTVKSVQNLHQLSKETINPFLKNKYSEAIVQIQSRLGNVENGWVSVPEEKDLDGALSKEAVGKKGELSREEV